MNSNGNNNSSRRNKISKNTLNSKDNDNDSYTKLVNKTIRRTTTTITVIFVRAATMRSELIKLMRIQQ